MTSFEILDRHLSIFSPKFIEASAGTGKTFAIENLVLRLILEKESKLNIDEILVITFTKEATRQLKERIRKLFQKSLEELKTETITDKDYLNAIIEKGGASLELAIKQIQRALFCFDSAQIMTIHSFCFRLLSEIKGHIFLEETAEITQEEKKQIVTDFFRLDLSGQQISKSQLKVCLKQFRDDPGKLIEKISAYLTETVAEPLYISFESVYEKFMKWIEACDVHQLGSEWYMELPQSFSSMANREGIIYPCVNQFFQKLNYFLFEDRSRDSFDQLAISFLELKEKINQKKKSTLNTPEKRFFGSFLEFGSPLFSKLLDPTSCFYQLLKGSQKLAKAYFESKNKLNPDDYVWMLKDALKQHSFLKRSRNRYQAAIVDEFQDTDPVQWEILSQLFLEGHEEIFPFYVVGDPKQSIYAFRNADIYTYYHAKQCMGANSVVSLNTNYRSEAALVEALNRLFCNTGYQHLITLPREKLSLSIPKLRPKMHSEAVSFKDNLGCIHFMVVKENLGKKKSWPTLECEQDYYFPYIAKQIQYLQKEENISLKSIAILVRDRFQARRLEHYFKDLGLPAKAQRSITLMETGFVEAMEEVLEAVLYPKNISLVKKALGGKIISYNAQELIDFDQAAHETLLPQLYYLKNKWLEEGFYPFFQKFFYEPWDDQLLSIASRHLSQQGGDETIQYVEQVTELIVEEEREQHLEPVDTILFLKKLLAGHVENYQKWTAYSNSDDDQVQILTIHMSKGLEYDIVFPLGLINRFEPKDNLFPVYKNGIKTYLSSDTALDQYQYYLEDQDAEKMRFLYVALTRAKKRIYVPIAYAEDKPIPKTGSASPMELFIALFQSQLHDKIYMKMDQKQLALFLNFIDSQKPYITYSYLSKEERPTYSLPCENKITLQSPSEVNLKNFSYPLVSFSSLNVSNFSLEQNFDAPTEFNLQDKTVYNLPSGVATGNVLHECFQLIDWKYFQSESISCDMQDWIQKKLKMSNFENWSSVIGQLLFETVKTPLYTSEKSILLSNVNPFDMYREVPFMYNEQQLNTTCTSETSSRLVQGVIDAIFVYDGLYYLVDYKSNWLGPDAAFYQKPYLKQAMDKHGYFLQAKLYKEALMRYLNLCEPKPFQAAFGGIFYLFVRGINRKNPKNTGVFYLKGDEI